MDSGTERYSRELRSIRRTDLHGASVGIIEEMQLYSRQVVTADGINHAYEGISGFLPPFSKHL